MKPSNRLNDVLNTDREYRKYSDRSDNTEDMFKLDNINLDEKWLFEYPTVVSKDLKLICARSKEFRKVVREQYGYLKGIDYNHIFIAGGFVSNIICGLPVNDIDLFIHSMEIHDANNLVFDTINTIIDNIKKINGNGKYTIINSSNSVTIILSNKMKIQIIYRLYRSKSEIIHGFDLGSSAVGFDGKHVYLTSLGKFAYEYKANVIDTTRRSTTYETRLIKYLKRGFNIIMPEFSMKKLSKKYNKYGLNTLIDMPYMKLVVSKIGHNYLEYVNCVDEKKDFSEYYDYNVRSKIIINDEMNISCERFMEHDKNKYIVKNDYDTAHITDMIIDFTSASLETKTQIVRFINNNFVIKPEWRTQNPGTQLTGSFNPIIEDAHLWYGRFYNSERIKYNKFVIVFYILSIILVVYAYMNKTDTIIFKV